MNIFGPPASSRQICFNLPTSVDLQAHYVGWKPAVGNGGAA